MSVVQGTTNFHSSLPMKPVLVCRSVSSTLITSWCFQWGVQSADHLIMSFPQSFICSHANSSSRCNSTVAVHPQIHSLMSLHSQWLMGNVVVFDITLNVMCSSSLELFPYIQLYQKWWLWAVRSQRAKNKIK